MKEKRYSISVLGNKEVTQEKDVKFYTTDTDAWLVLKLSDNGLAPETAEITLYNIDDRSVVNESVSVNDNRINYYVRPEIIEHAGNWQAQLVFEVGEKEYTSKIIKFNVQGHIMDGKEPSLEVIETFSRAKMFIQEAEIQEADRVASEEEREEVFNQLVEDGIIESAIQDKLNRLEESYAPRLKRLEEDNESLNTQLAHIALDIKSDFGATGDGVTDDTNAFLSFNEYIENINGGFKLLIPEGVYRVGKQLHVNGEYPYYQNVGSIIKIDGKENFIIEMRGTLKTNDGLYYGSFDKDTGEIYNAQSGGFTDWNYAAILGNIIDISHSKNFTLISPRTDGNMDNINVGGYWGDEDIQLRHNGLNINMCEDFTVINPETNNMCLDGLYIRGEEMNGTIINPRAKKNGRQGFSITASESGLNVYGGVFEETGKGKVSSAPKAGLDIEDNGEDNKGISFYGTIFRNNSGFDILAVKTNESETGDIKFNNVKAYSENGSSSIWIDVPGVEFHDSILGGIRVSNENTKYFNTIIKKNVIDHTSSHLLMENVSTENEFYNCEIYIVRDSVNIYTDKEVLFKDTKFIFDVPNLTNRQRLATISNAILDNCKFLEIDNGTYLDKSSGEKAYIQLSNIKYQTKNYFRMDNIAIDSRSGDVNTTRGNSQIGFQYSERITFTIEGLNQTTPYLTDYLPRGSYLLQIYKTSGNVVYRNFGATILIINGSGSALDRRSGVILNQTDVLPTNISIDVNTTGIRLKFDPTTNPDLNGEVFHMVAISLTPFEESLE